MEKVLCLLKEGSGAKGAVTRTTKKMWSRGLFMSVGNLVLFVGLLLSSALLVVLFKRVTGVLCWEEGAYRL